METMDVVAHLMTATKIRCPYCTDEFYGTVPSNEFERFRGKHLNCHGKKHDCECEWERLCDGSTLISRATPPCERCQVDFPDGSCLKCQGCIDCTEAPRTPMTLGVAAGQHDHELLDILAELEIVRAVSARMSVGEEHLIKIVWRRLNHITS